jgi:hypothetical protein
VTIRTARTELTAADCVAVAQDLFPARTVLSRAAAPKFMSMPALHRTAWRYAVCNIEGDARLLHGARHVYASLCEGACCLGGEPEI